MKSNLVSHEKQRGSIVVGLEEGFEVVADVGGWVWRVVVVLVADARRKLWIRMWMESGSMGVGVVVCVDGDG